MRNIFIGTFSAVMLMTAAAGAQQISEGHLDAIDTDNNGAVSRAEYEAFMSSAFTTLDTNGNGSLSAAEAAKVLSPEQFATVDTNKNGRISRDEFMQQVMKDYAAADKNGDGSLR